ncbi:hypothetical protein [Cellulomonas sp. S1-8]|uniref:hypothetical protein n=1 Tax=Cellulomonas sp. S1-8 TaxID=2904790 RepID=UPI0022432983|nr:hypothetical protein [Cellulomonas sp. S1-8]UZN02792.1 hypothetical protein OKX07_17315 [Cellulomonas sp. S1-8]
MDWPTVILILGVLAIATFVAVIVVATRNESRRLDIDTERSEEIRRLVTRYEELATGTRDAQQRAAADLAELHTRVVGVEKLLRSVE